VRIITAETIKIIRDWLRIVCGPGVDSVSDQRAVDRFRNIRDFYGRAILAKWKPPIPEVEV
jgi:hypothetical protein